MKIAERLKSVPGCSDADLAAILAILESKEYGYDRNDEATGPFTALDATQLELNFKRKTILRTAVQAASSQGMAPAVKCTNNRPLLSQCMIQLQSLLAAGNPVLWAGSFGCNLDQVGKAVLCTAARWCMQA